MIFAVILFGMLTVSNASAQDVQMAQVKESETIKVEKDESNLSNVLSNKNQTETDEFVGFDLSLGIGFTNSYGLPVYLGASYQFADFYRMGIDIKLALLFEYMFTTTWMHMFEFFSNEYIALSVGAGIGYMASDNITLRLDGSYDEDDNDYDGKKGIVFPAAFTFDWHTSKDVSLRVLVDLNNYYVMVDNREWKRCKVPRYEFHYDVIFQAVMHF